MTVKVKVVHSNIQDNSTGECSYHFSFKPLLAQIPMSYPNSIPPSDAMTEAARTYSDPHGDLDLLSSTTSLVRGDVSRWICV